MSLLGRVHEALVAARCAHALIGAAALAARGVVRSTLDLDLLTVSNAALTPHPWLRLRSAGFDVDVRVGDEDDPLAGVVRLEGSGERSVDVVVGRARWQQRIIERAEPMDVLDVRIKVVAAADLVLLKLYAGGSRDRWDIEELLAVADREDLVATIDGRLDDLPEDAVELWQQMRSKR